MTRWIKTVTSCDRPPDAQVAICTRTVTEDCLSAGLIRRAWGWPRAIRDWPLWELPGWLSSLVVAVAAVYAAGLVIAGISLRAQLHDLGLFAILLGFGTVAIELTRRAGEPAGFRRDANGIWLLPMAILLPPFYCMAAQLLKSVLLESRIRRYVAHRRVFNAGVHGLAYGAVSLIFHVIAPHLPALSPHPGVAWLLRGLAITGCALLRVAINRPLILVAVKGSDPTFKMRNELLKGDQLYNDMCELTAGVVVTILLAATSSWFLIILALPLVTTLQRSLRHAQLLDAARIDAKTGLLNAVAWQREARVELTRASRTHTPLAVAMLDIDHFKRVNDTYGHLTGDAVLASLAAAMRGLLRDYDITGRFGGEEFTILLPHTDAESARQIAERLRAKLAQISVATGVAGDDQSSLRVTVSIGVATLATSRRDLEELLAAADAALYRAKGAGRDRVVMINEDDYATSSPGGGGPADTRSG
jgi:diguanylate cyclase (GGDEF)-like protein